MTASPQATFFQSNNQRSNNTVGQKIDNIVLHKML